MQRLWKESVSSATWQEETVGKFLGNKRKQNTFGGNPTDYFSPSEDDVKELSIYHDLLLIPV